jgi:hypothetical protein
MFEDSMCLKDVITFDQSARTRYQNYNKTPSSKTHTPPRKSHRIPSPKTPNSPHQKKHMSRQKEMLLCICSLKKERKCIIEKEEQKGRDNKDRTSPKKTPKHLLISPAVFFLSFVQFIILVSSTVIVTT